MTDAFDIHIAIRSKDHDGLLSDISSDLADLRAWVDDQSTPRTEQVAEADDEANPPAPREAEQRDLGSDLRQMADAFEEAMAAYRSVVTLAGAMESTFPKVMFDVEIRKRAETVGHYIEDRGNYRIYGFTGAHSHDLYTAILRISDYRVGTEQLKPALLLSLVARYDSFIKDFLKRILREYPSRYEGSEKKIAIGELLTLSSFEEMIDKVIEDELSDLLRGSHAEHDAFIKNTFGVTLNKDFRGWVKYLELFERRNLVAHNNLVVDKQYIRNVSRFGGRDYALPTVGTVLDVDQKYLSAAVDLLTEAGARLIFELWRKHSKDSGEKAYGFMNEFCFNLIRNQRHKLAAKILTYILDQSTPKNPERVRRMMAVNLANAYRIDGKTKERDAALSRFQWDACSDQFKICVAAVREDVSAVVPLMEKVRGESDVGRVGFRTWPVFEGVRRETAFAAEFERLFGESISAGESTSDIDPLDTGRPDLKPTKKGTARARSSRVALKTSKATA